MTNSNIVSIFSIFKINGQKITEGLSFQQAINIKNSMGCIIKFQSFVEVK